MPCISSLIQKCSYPGNRKIIFRGQARGSIKCVENVTVKIRLHRINGGEVRHTVLGMFERKDTGQSRMMSEEEGRKSAKAMVWV